MFERMLSHPNIELRLGRDFEEIGNSISYKRLIYTGRIDEFFEYRYGKLPYRSLRFNHVTLDKPWHQSVAVVNYPQNEQFTRVTEYKHLTGQNHSKIIPCRVRKTHDCLSNTRSLLLTRRTYGL